MRVIARSTLTGFVRIHVPAKLQKVVATHLSTWYAEVSRANWNNSAELKAQYCSASIISAERAVFNIKGNDYRLVVAVNYQYKAVRIKWLGTHKEYDRIDVETIPYDGDRYADPSHQN